MKHVLVTGGAGFIGSHIVDKFLSLDYQVSVIDNETSDGHDKYYWNPLANNYRADICNYSSISDLFGGVDAVFHLAAKVSVQESVEDPMPTFVTNAMGTANVLEAARRASVGKFIYSSTSAVYGEENPVPSLESMREDPLNTYAIGKLAGEHLVRSYHHLYGMNTVTFRYTNVYGPRSRHTGTYAPVVTRFIDRKKNKEPLLIFGDGEQRRDFIHVYDVVDANYSAYVNVLDKWGDTYNIGYGKNWSINELAAAISSDVQKHPPRAGEMRETLANIEKAKSDLTWQPNIDIMDWLVGRV